MSKQAIINPDICFGGYKLQSLLSSMNIDQTADAVESTTFGSGGDRDFTPGLQGTGFGAVGFMENDAVDGALQSALAVADTVVQVCPQNGTAGGPAAFFKALTTSYQMTGAVGDMLGFTLGAQCNAPEGLIRGTLMVNSTAVTSTTTSTGRQLGAIGAGQTLYAALNVFGVDGTSPELVVTVESDDNADFTSATTQATFSTFDAIGAEIQTVAGAVTDDYWRVVATISGSDPVFGVMISLGIK